MTHNISAAANKPRILIVEDEMIVALDLQQQLRALGCDPVGHATRGEQAIRLATELRPDLVLMDVRLADDMDGIQAAQAIRTQLGVASVFLSAFTDDAARDRAQLCDPAGYLDKPYDTEALREVIAAFVERAG